MGLDTTHDAWHGPYSSFNRFRHETARRIGLNLDEYNGYGKGGNKDLASINHPLMPFFNHSDCDGDFSPEECKQIADAFDAIIKASVPDEDSFSGFVRAATRFMDGCRRAYELNEKLEFH